MSYQKQKKTTKNRHNLYYKLKQALAVILSFCIASIIVTFSIKLIWQIFHIA